MSRHADAVIVGAGHGGAHAAIMLRRLGFTGSIALVGNETELPYERPPLSKEYLAGNKTFERILIRPAGFWAERNIQMMLATEVIAIDPTARRLTCAYGEEIEYGVLIWAAGGEPRKLTCSGRDLKGVHAVRTHADVLRMLDELSTARQVVIVGGGFIGLEAAAVLCKLGKKVVLLEALDRVLARVAGIELSRFYESEHRSHGVDLRTNTKIECIEEKDGRACGVRLQGGEVVPAELVIVGIGIIPSVEPLLRAGAEGNNGVAVDVYCRTSLPNIYAIGDCAAHVNAFSNGATIRLESVQNANDQAATAARAITGKPTRYEATPWFWSNQYDLRLQTIGLSAGYDYTVVRGSPVSRSFSVIYLKNGRVIALDCVNAVKDFVQGKELVETRAVIAPAILADPTKPLKQLMKEVS